MPKNLGVPATDALIAPAARDRLAAEIAAAGGNEVFFFGTVDAAGVLAVVEAVARGSSDQVPVFLERAGEHNVLLHNHPGGDLTPSPADLVVASEAGVRGLGFFIISNDALHVYRVVEPFAKREETPLDPDEIAAIFSHGGLLDRKIPGFEERVGQRDMAVAVAHAFNGHRIVAYEGGTGIGKSYAYLVPAILWAARNRSRVIVSTQTIALGEQLIQKDLPLLARVLEEEFSYALIKGRGNYACKRKTLEVERKPELFGDDPEQQRWQQEILAHLAGGGEGSLSDLPRVPPSDVWSHFESTTDQSLKVKCKFYGECFYYEARRLAARAHIVVVNHHLFFADLALRRASSDFATDIVLPGYRRVIFDEAHRLEEVAAEHLGSSFSRLGVQQALGRLVSRREGGAGKGRLAYVQSLLARTGAEATREFLEFEVAPHVQELRAPLDAHFDELRQRIESAGRPTGEDDEPPAAEAVPALGGAARVESIPFAVRVGERERDFPMVVARAPVVRIREDLDRLRAKLAEALERLDRERCASEEDRAIAAGELRGAQRALVSAIDAAGSFLADARGAVSWVEFDRGARRNLVLRSAPVRVAQILAESLYQPLDAVLMTSATLSVRGRWDFLGDRLGWSLVEEGRFEGSEFPSPFDYRRQVLLALPDDGPLPSEAGYDERLARMVIDSARAARGRLFVLFTSHRQLRAVAARTNAALRELGLAVLVQGTEPRTTLLSRFRAAGNAVLFGNQTFWEGIDVPGEALSCVLITKLPFRVPTHPLEMARAEELEERGENPFVRLSVPQAVLALKQGYGRLVRTQADHGVVIIADRRIHQKSYGATFLRSLPESRRLVGAWEEIVPELDRYFAMPAVDESTLGIEERGEF